MDVNADWISASEAADLLTRQTKDDALSRKLILTRLYEGRLEARGIVVPPHPNGAPVTIAVTRRGSLMSKGHSGVKATRSTPVMIDKDLWNKSVESNRDSDAFDWRGNKARITTARETSNSRRSARIYILDVEFIRSAIERILSEPLVREKPSESFSQNSPAGRKRGEDWYIWVAELAAFVHEEGFKSTISAPDLNQLICDRIRSNSPDFKTLDKFDPAAAAVLRRMRAGNYGY